MIRRDITQTEPNDGTRHSLASNIIIPPLYYRAIASNYHFRIP